MLFIVTGCIPFQKHSVSQISYPQERSETQTPPSSEKKLQDHSDIFIRGQSSTENPDIQHPLEPRKNITFVDRMPEPNNSMGGKKNDNFSHIQVPEVMQKNPAVNYTANIPDGATHPHQPDISPSKKTDSVFIFSENTPLPDEKKHFSLQHLQDTSNKTSDLFLQNTRKSFTLDSDLPTLSEFTPDSNLKSSSELAAEPQPAQKRIPEKTSTPSSTQPPAPTHTPPVKLSIQNACFVTAIKGYHDFHPLPENYVFHTGQDALLYFEALNVAALITPSGAQTHLKIRYEIITSSGKVVTSHSAKNLATLPLADSSLSEGMNSFSGVRTEGTFCGCGFRIPPLPYLEKNAHRYTFRLFLEDVKSGECDQCEIPIFIQHGK